jgi:hypothetical protein
MVIEVTQAQTVAAVASGVIAVAHTYGTPSVVTDRKPDVDEGWQVRVGRAHRVERDPAKPRRGELAVSEPG